MTRVISASTHINGVRLVHHISFANTVAYLYLFLIVFFETVLPTFRESFKKFNRQLLFLRNHLKE